MPRRQALTAPADRVRRSFEARLGLAAGSLAGDGWQVVVGPAGDLPDVVVLTWGRATAVTAPLARHAPLARLGGADGAPHERVREALGTAVLDVLGPARLLVPVRLPVAQAPGPVELDADDPRLAALWATLDPTERDEASLGGIATYQVVLRGDAVVAAAGATPARGGVAELTVAVSPGERGAGLGRRVLRAAVAALPDQVVPLARVRVGNAASERVVASLGFVARGSQTLLRCAPA